MHSYIQKQNKKLDQWVLDIENARPTKEQTRRMAQLLYDLYVTESKKRLKQYWNGKAQKAEYVTEEAGKGYLAKAKYAITTGVLERHVKGEMTYGVFSGSELSKFMCFDIDYGSWESSETWARKVINSLLRHGIAREQIHVSFSGKKGFHIDLFFSRALQVKTMKLFYEHIVRDIEAGPQKVEFRPTSTQGVKLPVGVHVGTHTICYFVPNDSFDTFGIIGKGAAGTIEYLEKALQSRIDAHSFIDMCKKLQPTLNTITVKQEHVGQTEKLLSKAKANMEQTFQSAEDKVRYCEKLLQEKQLLYKGTRHNVTLLLSQYFKDMEYEQEQTAEQVTAFITAAYANDRSKFSEETTLEHAIDEVGRLVRITYENGYSLYNEGRKEWELYESELTYILETVNKTTEKKKQPLVQLAFAFLMESKKHAKKSNGYVFYSAYSTIGKYGCDTNRKRLKLQIDKLVGIGLMDIAKPTEQLGKHKTPYYFRVNVPKADSDSNKLVITAENAEGDKKIDTIIATLLAEEKASKLVSKKVYYERLKPIYKAV